jgi:hypothetical protein
MNAQLDLPDREFSEASNSWDLEHFLTDLREKNEFLTTREQKMLRGLLCEYSPKEIAKIGFGKDDSDSIRPDLSKIYEYAEILIATKLGSSPPVDSQNIRRLLKKAGYARIENAI